tara:strand:+ start:264 stop:407 length:144 start_codon:yes stop_codon:yes gene_type:complete
MQVVGIVGLGDERNFVEKYNVTTPPINANITNKIILTSGISINITIN